MATRLQQHTDVHGPEFEIKGRTYRLAGFSGDGDLALATFATKKASYTGVKCADAKAIGHPDAEVWAIIQGRRTLARFAVTDSGLRALA